MTGLEMIKEMKANGYATQYTEEWFIKAFDEATIKRFYDRFMEHLKERG